MKRIQNKEVVKNTTLNDQEAGELPKAVLLPSLTPPCMEITHISSSDEAVIFRLDEITLNVVGDSLYFSTLQSL